MAGVEIVVVHHYAVAERCVYLRNEGIHLFCCGVWLAQMKDG